MAKSLYLNLEDDITKITSRLEKESSDEIVLVVPKKSFLFSDSINLRLLKKQADVLGKSVAIMTMDELGQVYAKEAGFELKFLSKQPRSGSTADIRRELITPGQKTVSRKTVTKKLAPDLESSPRAIKTTARLFSPPQTTSNVAVRDTIFPQAQTAKAFSLSPQNGSTKNRKVQKALLSFVIVSLIVVLALVFVILPSAEVTVYAKTQAVARDIDISISASLTEPDSAKLALPATRLDQNIEATNSFNSTGKKEVGSKSQGTVAIYNLTGKTLNLKAATTTLTAGTKTYIFTKDQTGIKPSSNKDTPSIKAEVVASSGGEASNLPAGTRLEITNQVFGNQPQTLFAKSDSAISGGNSRFLTLVSEQDLNNAKLSLTESMLSDLRKNLDTRGLVLPDKAYVLSEQQYLPSVVPNTEAQTFSATASSKLTGLAFNTQQLLTIIRQRVSMTLDSAIQLQDQTKDVLSYAVKEIDVPTGIMRISVHYESVAVGQVAENSITGTIAGKTKAEASELLLSNSQIDHIDIALKPKWQTTIPRFGQKIHVSIK